MAAEPHWGLEAHDLTRVAMIPWLSGERFTPNRYHFLAQTDSTNRQAAILARQGAPEGTVVVADAQTNGRGRQGRTWHSPPGCNLYFSMVLRGEVTPRRAHHWNLVAGVALAATITGLGDGSVVIKWPNDLLLNHRKVAGILSEMGEEAGNACWLVIGIGINVNATLADFPSDLGDSVTSLQLAFARPVSRSRVLADFLLQFDQVCHRYQVQGLAGIRQEWLAGSQLLGRRLWIRQPEADFAGVAMDLDEEGFLRVRDDQGIERRVVTGEIF